MTVPMTRHLRIAVAATNVDFAQATLAVAATNAAIAKEALAKEKAAFIAENPVGTRLIVTDDERRVLGAVQVNNGKQGHDSIVISDLAEVLPWAQDMFGDCAVEVKLSPQGTNSVIAHAKARHEKGETLPAGVKLVKGVAGSDYVSWKADAKLNVGVALERMASRGAIDLGRTLALEAGE